MYATERRVAQLCWRILGDAEEVKDAVQETFLRVFRFRAEADKLSRMAASALEEFKAGRTEELDPERL